MEAAHLRDARLAAATAQRLRALHLEMVDAVLSGDGLKRLAQLASAGTGGAVAIILPRLAAAVIWPRAAAEGRRLRDLERYVAARLRGRPARVPETVVHELAIAAGDERLGAVLLLEGDTEPSPEAFEVLHLAAVTCLTEVAIEEAREQVEQSVRGSFLEDLRARHDLGGDEIAGRAQRLGCDLTGGAVSLCAQVTSGRPRQMLATIGGEHPGSLAEHVDGRVYALLPAAANGGSETTLAAAHALAARLKSHGVVGVSSFYPDPADLPRAIQEAELVVDVLRHGDVPIAEDIAGGAYRLLFRVLASDPAEIRSFYEDTVAPIVSYDRQYRTDLTGTLETYLGHNCNMNATAAAIFAHRHTVGYRLERIRELTGLDPMLSEDRERLGLGLKAYRIIAPRLPK
jgi:PucR family transcriptional regulator, purine catabolism regulatory protein